MMVLWLSLISFSKKFVFTPKKIPYKSKTILSKNLKNAKNGQDN